MRRVSRRGYDDDSVSTSDESTEDTQGIEDGERLKQNFEQFIKQAMVSQVLKTNRVFVISFEVLYLAVECIERYIEYVAERFEFIEMTDQNLKEFKLSAMIILNLASKYYDRVAYSISDLVT